MRIARHVMVAGIAAAALAGVSGTALAGDAALHSMAIRLPDGEVAQIQYAGAVPPQVMVDAEPLAAAMGGPGGPFAMIAQMSAEMDQEMRSLLRMADTMAMPPWTPEGRPGQLVEASLGGGLPAGVTGYSMVSTTASDGAVCVRSTQITSLGNGQPPKVVTRTSGTCGPEAGVAASRGSGVPSWTGGAPVTEVSAVRDGQPVGAMVRDAVYRRAQ